MAYDVDVLVIGLGPAGMAVSIMASEMGLKVCAVEKQAVGGECMNVGCIPSKALLRMAKARAAFDHLSEMELESSPKPQSRAPFSRIQEHLTFISEKKTLGMFKKVEMVYRQGAARFVDAHTVAVGERHISAKRIFLCTGTRPSLPKIPGLDRVPVLTNENLFSLESVPKRLIVLGGGAIACEMAQALQRLGSQVTMIIRGPRLIWREDVEASRLLESTFEGEGMRILREQKPVRFELTDEGLIMETDAGEQVEAEKILVAAGRSFDFSALDLEKAGVAATEKGITVNRHLQTSRPHIYACGDCNGFAQFSHAAMHQGMIALMNSMSFWPFKQDYRKFVVPWTVFTTPQYSHVGLSERELEARGMAYEVIEVKYEDYGAAIAENIAQGFVKVFASTTGRIYGATIIGEGSGEMINEWALAVQKKIRLHDIMLLQHSFPTMGFLSKRAGETWMMKRMASETLKKLCRFMFRL